ncbi:MAG: hypothetical protein RIF37_13235 [Rhodospirillaceae bacterium]
MNYALRQTGRASLNFAGEIARQLLVQSEAVAQKVADAGLSSDILAEDLDKRDQRVLAVADKLPGFRVINLGCELYCDHDGQIAASAFCEIEEDITSQFLAVEDGLTILEVCSLRVVVGFVDIERFGMPIGSYPFPYVSRASKYIHQ